MPSPFPGMLPYRESPALWPDVRNTIIGLIRELHSPGLRPDCFCQVEDRVCIVDEDDPTRSVLIPDDAILEAQGGAFKPGCRIDLGDRCRADSRREFR
jgi:hypothetical protein